MEDFSVDDIGGTFEALNDGFESTNKLKVGESIVGFVKGIKEVKGKYGPAPAFWMVQNGQEKTYIGGGNAKYVALAMKKFADKIVPKDQKEAAEMEKYGPLMGHLFKITRIEDRIDKNGKAQSNFLFSADKTKKLEDEIR